MKCEWGALVVNGRGKLGGHVASKNRAGSYFRTKVTPINRRSTFQTAVRSRLASISSGFKTLTAAQIAAWNAAVGDFVHTNVFGQKVHPTGAQLYQRLNNNLVNIGIAQITTPPLPVNVSNMGTLTLTGAHGTPALSLAFTTPIPAAEKVILSATAGLSAGKNFVKSEFREIGVLVTGDTTPKDILTLYTAKFGSIPAAGKKVFIRVKNVNATTGQAGVGLTASCVIAA
jgi:hypothetical protein